MKETGMIFTAESVRAILDGRKMQTRRIVKPQEWRDGRFKIELLHDVFSEIPIGLPCVAVKGLYAAYANPLGAISVNASDNGKLGIKPAEFRWISPYGTIGDRLWVRETIRHHGNSHIGDNPVKACVTYRADGESAGCGSWGSFSDAPIQKWWNTGEEKWMSPRFMPRWASRITLEITDVRVQRLQEINEQDATAEGFIGETQPRDDYDGLLCTAKKEFMVGWDAINYKRAPWESNPFVWCISFRRII